MEAVLAVTSGIHFNQYSDLTLTEEDAEWVSIVEQLGCKHIDSEKALWSLSCSESELMENLTELGITATRSDVITDWVLTNIEGVNKEDILEGYEIVEDIPVEVGETRITDVDLVDLLGELNITLID